MQDPAQCSAFSKFLSRFQPSIVMLNGDARGTEFPVDQVRTTLGRGPGVDLAFDDAKMSREHALVRFSGDGFVLRQLPDAQPVLLNGGEVDHGELKDGDRIVLGSHAFEFVIEERVASRSQ